MNIIFFISSSLIFIFTCAVIYFFLSRKKFFNADEAKKSCTQIEKTKNLDPNHSLMESHKILVASIETLTKKKTTAAKTLNKISKRLKSDKSMWKFHRMRNQAAHEINFKVTESEAKEARKVFKAVVKELTN